LSAEDPDSKESDLGLTWKDYVALFIAVLQTLALPLVAMIVVLIVVLALVGVFR
jgi:hypothetical protein